MRLMPERKPGIAVFTNTGGNTVASILINRIHDHFGGNAARAVAGPLTRHAPQGTRAAEIGRGGKAGSVRSRTRGQATTSRIFAAPTNIRPMAGWSSRRMATACTGPGAAPSRSWRTGTTIHSSCPMSWVISIRTISLITFATDRDGNIASLSAQLEPQVADIVFTRAPPASAWTQRSARRAPASTFAAMQPRSSHCRCRGPAHAENPVPAALPAAPLSGRDLRHRHSSTAIASNSAAAPAGKIEELVYHQPNGTFIAKRKSA